MRTGRSVLWVSTSTATHGGVASYVRTMQETPLWDRWSIAHVATHEDGSVARRLTRFACGLLVIVARLLLRRPALVHLHSASRGSFARKSLVAWLCRALDVPVVLHVHGGGFADFHAGSPAPVRRYIRATLEGPGAVVALGPSWAERLQKIAPAARVVVVPNAVAPLAYANPGPADGEPVTVLFLGQVSEAKGTFVLVEAWARVFATTPLPVPPQLVVAGDGQVEALRRLARMRGVEDSVHLPGWVSRERVEALLLQSQVLVLPSRWEGHPMSVLEAMARGLAVVATPVGGVPDLVDATSGLLVPPDDAEALAGALRGLLLNPTERIRLGEGGLARVHREFDVAVTWRALDGLYEELVHA